MKKIISEQFDVLVIGGGPAGLMAASRASAKGVRVALVEKNDRYGIKLLMTGNGRCNVTQDEDNMRELAKKYKNGKFLLSAFNTVSPKFLREFLKKRGLETKVEKSGKVFPVSDQSKDVVDALYQYCRENGVTFFNTEDVVDIVMNEVAPSEIQDKPGFANGEISRGKIEKVVTKKKEISATNYILATGGKSYPGTGSAGDGYDWAEKLGHTIIEPMPVLVPIRTNEKWTEELQGVSAGSVEISAWQDGKKKFADNGDLMFAHFGLSGPLVFNLSRKISELQAKGEVMLKIDLKPYLAFEKLDEIVRVDFERNATKQLVNCLHDIFSPKLLDFLFKQSGLDLKKHAANISKGDRQKLVRLFKSLELTVESLFGFERAMVTSGGVSTKEIDPKTMQSKIIENLYFAGEIIDADGPTGGYNLQICWSTGYVAGESAATKPLVA